LQKTLNEFDWNQEKPLRRKSLRLKKQLRGKHSLRHLMVMREVLDRRYA